MNAHRERLLLELKAYGEANDAAAAARSDKMLNITADTGRWLWMLLRALKPRRVLEVGTSNGYSTIWWADALPGPEQQLVTLESNPAKVAQATQNFRRAGLADRIQMVVGDAGDFLHQADAAAWDLIFLDAERSEYVGYWPDLMRMLAPDGLIVADNAVDKAAELEAFRSIVEGSAGWRQVLVPIGNGELFIQRDLGC